MNDHEFMVQIIAEICDYAVKNKMEPNDTLRTIAENIDMMLEISNFNNWQPTNVAAQEGKKSGWISVEDRLPEEPGSYLCWFGKNMLAPGMSVVSYIPKLHGFGSLEYYKVYENVTHWMPLPEPPKENFVDK